MRRRMKWLAGGATALALTLGAGPALAGPSVVRAAGPLSDLSSGANPTDGAHGRLVAMAPGNGTTYFVFVVRGLDPEAAGTTLGAHVHVGPCLAGNGGAAGPHYNTGTGGPPSPDNEVWLDFTILPGGLAYAYAVAPFEIAPGDAQSVVIHALPTEEGTGLAGARLACLPVQF
jgi:hypothetical protein